MAKSYKKYFLVFFYILATSNTEAFNFFSLWKNLSNFPSPLTILSEHFNISSEQVASFATSLAFHEDGVSPDDIKILLYKEYDTFYPYFLNSSSIPLDLNQDIKVIIHGYKSFGTADWAEMLSKTYHKVGITNTLGIDWYNLANREYLTSATSTKRVGHYIANWLFYNLLQSNPKVLRKVHLIGHSLGAHIAGFVGKRIIEITGGKYRIGKISGLEAAAPLFEFPVKLPSAFRIYFEDAQIVEGFHTNMGIFGFFSEYGHRDFYISSGGPIQAACDKGFNIIESMSCSHSIVTEIFRKIVESKDFIAIKYRRGVQNRSSLRSLEETQIIIVGEHGNATGQYGSFFINVDKDMNPKPPILNDI